MLKAIIFDVDGVLVDSREANVAVYQSILGEAGYDNVTREQILECFHMPLYQSIQHLTGLKDEVQIRKIFESAKAPRHRQSHLFQFPEQLESILESLHKKYRLGIVTSRIRVGLDHIFDSREIAHFFDVTITFDDVTNPKPHPEPLLLAIKKLGLKPGEALYVGDSDSDIDAAFAAGMPSIHLAKKHHKDATYGIERFDELMSVIDRLG